MNSSAYKVVILLAVLRVVLPFKTDAAVFQCAKAMVGDGYAMGIARQILEHALRSAERRLDVNHPFDFGGLLAQGLEWSGRSQRAKLAGETQGAAAEGLAQLPQELLAEALAEQEIGKKEGVFAARDPVRTIGRDASAGHHANADGDAAILAHNTLSADDTRVRFSICSILAATLFSGSFAAPNEATVRLASWIQVGSD